MWQGKVGDKTHYIRSWGANDLCQWWLVICCQEIRTGERVKEGIWK